MQVIQFCFCKRILENKSHTCNRWKQDYFLNSHKAVIRWSFNFFHLGLFFNWVNWMWICDVRREKFQSSNIFYQVWMGRRNKKVNCKYTLGNKHLYFPFIFFILCNDEDISFCTVNTSYCQCWQLNKIACLLTKRSSGEAMIRALHEVHNTPYNSQLTLLPRGLRKWQGLQCALAANKWGISRSKAIKGRSALSQGVPFCPAERPQLTLSIDHPKTLQQNDLLLLRLLLALQNCSADAYVGVKDPK